MTTTKHEDNGAHERLAIADRLLVLALLIAGVVLAMSGDREHAGLLLAGALGALAPLGTRGTGAAGMARALPLALGLGAAMALSGCGAQLTAEQRGALAVETQLCIANERAIVDRVGTSEEEDRSDLAAERARCDAARAAISEGSP